MKIAESSVARSEECEAREEGISIGLATPDTLATTFDEEEVGVGRPPSCAVMAITQVSSPPIEKSDFRPSGWGQTSGAPCTLEECSIISKEPKDAQ